MLPQRIWWLFCPILLGAALVLSGCRDAHQPPAATDSVDEPANPPWFADITEQVGIDFIHDSGAAGSFFMPEIVGAGAALFDFNNDGLLDILLLQNGGPHGKKNVLYQQQPDGRFADVSAGSGLDFAGHNMGVAIGDVNNDGWPDVLITQYGGVRLLLNQGNGTFRDITDESGLNNPLWATSAAFLDYDRDGWLDLVVVNYVLFDPSYPCHRPGGQREYCAPSVFPGSVSRLFHNKGQPTAGAPAKTPSVQFEDVTLASGLGRRPGPGLGVFCHDFDGDGWIDIFVANDGKPNHLWINQHDGTFKEEAHTRGLAVNSMAVAEANMGVAVGDVDGDGLLDLFVTHLDTETNTLWKQERRGFFRDQTVHSDLARPRWRGTGFGTVLADFDHDGALDVVIANGRISRGSKFVNPDLGPFWKDYADRNQVFANDGHGRFRDISLDNPALCGTPGVYRGIAVGDIDRDGAVDVLVTPIVGRARLFRNVAPKRGHWLIVEAVDPARKRTALGSEITVEAAGRRWTGVIASAAGYLCSHDARAHFGLGAAARIDAIRVVWPDGSKETFPGGSVDRVVALRKGQGTAAP